MYTDMNMPSIQHMRNYIWLMPFICFFIGYAWIKYLYVPTEQVVPNIVGLHIYDALHQLSQQNLNIRILSEKTERELPAGTILWQTPSAGQRVKALQTIFCVTALQPKKLETLQCIGNSYDTIKKMAQAQNIKIKYYYLSHTVNSEGVCFGQYPTAGSLQSHNTIITYIAKQQDPYVIVPSFQGKTVKDIKEILANVNITDIHVQPMASHQCIHCKIKSQKPSAGSFLHISNLNKMELQVEHV